MRRRYVLLGLVIVAVFAVAMPALGASPGKLAKKALKTAKKANKNARKANKNAKLALSAIQAGVPTATNATNAQNAVNATNAVNAQNAVNAGTVDGKNASDFVPAGKVVTSGSVVKASTGQTKTVVSKGPFKFVMKCTSGSGSNRRVELTIETTEAGSTYDGGSGLGSTFGPGPGLSDIDVSGTGAVWAGFNYALAAPSGASLAGHSSAGAHVLGADCAAAVTGIG